MATQSALGHDGYTLPVGVVISFLGKTAPAGFLVCDGSTKTKAQYPELFRIIGGIGYGEDATTFNVPNLTNYFIKGTATNSNTKEAGSGTTAVQFSLTEANMPNFTTNSQNAITFTTNNIGSGGVITTSASTLTTAGSPTQTWNTAPSSVPQRNPPVVTSITGVTTSYTGTGSVQSLTTGLPTPQNYIVQFCIRADY
jgi:microcystin-dependent protein